MNSNQFNTQQNYEWLKTYMEAAPFTNYQQHDDFQFDFADMENAQIEN